jgi:hypothetical protein
MLCSSPPISGLAAVDVDQCHHSTAAKGWRMARRLTIFEVAALTALVLGLAGITFLLFSILATA